MMEKRLIINADDFGMTLGICAGICALAEQGAITSTTAMMCFPGALANIREHFSRLRVPSGVHLQLTAGLPLSPAMAAACAVGHDGAFPRRPDQADFPVDLVAAEWRAQVDFFIRHLGQPTHLDTHHNLHRLPAYRDAFFDVARHYELPVRGAGAEFARQARVAKVATTDVVDDRWTTTGAPVESLIETIEAAFAASTGGLVEIVVHPGYCDDELRRLSGLNDIREHERRVLSMPRLADYFTARDISLISYREVC